MADAVALLKAARAQETGGYVVVPAETLDMLFDGSDLPARCREIVQWRRSGRYEGTVLQRMADGLDDQSEEDPPLARAELQTIREVLRFAAAFDDDGARR
jgi:hypothetical protein